MMTKGQENNLRNRERPCSYDKFPEVDSLRRNKKIKYITKNIIYITQVYNNVFKQKTLRYQSNC